MSDYNSSTAALQAEHLDKWHTFNQVVPQTRTTPGWQQRKIYLANSALTVTGQTGVTGYTFNNNSNSLGTRLTLTTVGGTGTGTTFGTQLAFGDIVRFTVSGVSLDLTVQSIVEPASGPTQAVITFQETSYDAAQAWGTVAVSLTGISFTVPLYRATSAAQTSTVFSYQPTISQINIKAHGIDLYQYLPYQFYSTYLPYVFGGPNINTPADRGCHFINFAMYPGTYQPSGHVNISRAREFYFNYQSNVIGGTPTSPSVTNQPAPSTNSNSGYLYLLAAAINFLLISDGGAVLRYST